MSYFALLEPESGRTLPNLSKRSCPSISWLICFFKNPVDISCCSPAHPSSSSNTDFLRQQRWFRAQNSWLKLLFTVVSIAKHFNFFSALLCVADPSRASTNETTNTLGLELNEKIGSSIKLDEIDKDNGTSLPIQGVALVSRKLSSWTQVESKLNFATFLKSFCSSV